MNPTDDLERFSAAQNPVYDQVLAELGAARKTSHWMWFVFPQLRGLGRSETARHYGIASLDEARRYLQHPLLGSRLVECSALVLAAPASDPVAIFGAIDAIKLRSSMTLFESAAAAPAHRAFGQVLDRCFGGQRDPQTLQLLPPHPSPPGG